MRSDLTCSGRAVPVPSLSITCVELKVNKTVDNVSDH
jgi:hypothetical protein